VIEFIHTATLVHDDIIDEARLRRGRTSANARWGNNLTVLFGDYLYTMSMGIALDEGDLTILKVLSDTTLSMIEGEIIGIEKEGSIHVTREEALEITRRQDRRPLLRRVPPAGALRAARETCSRPSASPSTAAASAWPSSSSTTCSTTPGASRRSASPS
jgi:octaprenyl-diphosphate synthase